ncbi:immunoglobulin lambda-like polypeptide 1 [Oryx dammah]|nr:immunoglobulin lambda-like polypeptide 1 [Oryx dammah]
MRPRPGQGAREAPRGQRGVPRQPWPLILLGLAVGAHGLLPPTAAPQSTAPRMEAPAGKSPWSLWGR